jgi:hypothetical protein
MFTTIRFWLVAFCLLAGLLLLAGCGSAPGASGYGGSAGTGADSGPWPTAPAKAANGTQAPGSDSPVGPLVVLLQAKANPDETLALAVTKIELKYDNDHWYPLASADGKNGAAKLSATPCSADSKGAVFMLSSSSIPRRKYTAIRLWFDDDATHVTRKAAAPSTQPTPPTPVTIPVTLASSTLALSDWTLDPKLRNFILLQIDGTKLKANDNALQAPAEAVTVTKGTALGEISGTVVATIPNVTVEAYWGENKEALAPAVPVAQDGTFTLSNLPTGNYRLVVHATGFHPALPLKPVAVENAPIKLDAIKLVAD